MHASDVIRCFERMLLDAGVLIRLNTEVRALRAADGRISTVSLGKEELTPDAVVLATGGMSYPSTGSRGDGYRFARALGHTVTALYPSLVSLDAREQWCSDLSGLTLKNVSVKALDSEGRKIREEEGELLFTHKGVSGPAALRISAYVTRILHEGGEILLSLDLKPALTEDVLDERLLRELKEAGTKTLKNVMPNLAPKSLGRVILMKAGIPEETRASDVRREDRQALLRALKELTLHITGTGGFDEAIVTQGGISVREIEPATMKSKLYDNLFFAGEMIDTDLMTGGFSLQQAWSTGWLAGRSAAKLPSGSR
jgi:predicted Rossmann fold flavoprotein